MRRSDDAFTTLWSDSGPVALDRTHFVTADCIGSSVVVYVNGERILSVDDAEGPPNGGIGLYSHATAGNQFLEVRVALPQWLSYYRFGREGRFAAGSRLRVFSGSTAAPALVAPLETQRFATAQFDNADLQFKDAMADLRIVGPDGPEHTRRFLPDASYSTLGMRVLRAATEPHSCYSPIQAMPSHQGVTV